MNKRQFAIELGRLVMRALAEKLDPDELLVALEHQVEQERTIQKSRRAAERSY